MNRFILFIHLLILMPLLGCNNVAEENTISVVELKSLMQTDSTLVVIDVRNANELTGPLGSLDGIIHIPLGELSNRLPELDKYKTGTIAVICRSGNRSGVATNMLLEKGFVAKNVSGGMRAWKELK